MASEVLSWFTLCRLTLLQTGHVQFISTRIPRLRGRALLPWPIQMLFSFGRFNAAAYQRKTPSSLLDNEPTTCMDSIRIYFCVLKYSRTTSIRDDVWKRVPFAGFFFTKRLNNLFYVCRALFPNFTFNADFHLVLFCVKAPLSVCTASNENTLHFH